MFQVFIFYWNANEVREESIKISSAMYESNFFDFDISMKKKMIMIMMRAQKPIELTVGHWTGMTLGTFQTLLNTAYSYFNVARKFK